ncbi:MAG: hypothetical protein M1365_04645 [Actinobacteria bacterium]|nr:hypothetical protein [Actinomycetota bacterium]
MSKYKIPTKNPEPNIDEFLKIILGEIPVRRIPLVEYVIDDEIMKPILGNLIGRNG